MPAGILVSVAPGRPFTAEEVDVVRDFVESGGTFICTVGYERAGPSRDLLGAFGIYVGSRLEEDHPYFREPVPLGHFKAPYLRVRPEGGSEYYCYVRFHAGWPLEYDGDDVNVVAYGGGSSAIIVSRQHGKGTVVVVGDTGFAMTKNLEREDGKPIEGQYENAHFWRWYLRRLDRTVSDDDRWVPPPPPAPPARSPQPADGGARK
jgi:hypothetical protein